MADAPDLNTLKSKLKKLQASIACLTKEASATQTSIQTAEAQLAEIAKATNGYQDAALQTRQELADAKEVIAKERSFAESEIKDLKSELDKKIEEFEQALEDRKEAAKSAADTAARASEAATPAMKFLQEKQADFAELKETPGATKASLREITTLLNEVAKAKAKRDFIATYFYAVEAEAVAGELKVASPDDFKTQLVEAQTKIEKAKTEAAAKKKEADEAESAAADAGREHEAALASRRSDLLKALRKVKAPGDSEVKAPAHSGVADVEVLVSQPKDW